MQSAEEEAQSISAIAHSSVSGGQAFPIYAPTFPSQAECTLDRYKSGGRNNSDASGGCSNGYCLDRSNGSCGCRLVPALVARAPDTHGFTTVVVCPNANAPGICDKASRAYNEWRKKYKAKHEQRKRNCIVNYNTLSDKTRKRLRKPCLPVWHLMTLLLRQQSCLPW